MMKKLLALLMAALMLTSVLTACSKEEPTANDNAETVTEPENETNETDTEAEAPADEKPEAEAPSVETPEAEAPSVETPEAEAPSVETPEADAPSAEAPEAEAPSVETPQTDAPSAEAPEADAPAAQPSGDTPEAVINAIYGAFDTGLGSLMTMPVDIADPDALRYYTGLSDGSAVVEAAVSEPMMSSQAYSLVVVRVADPAQAESVAQQIKSGVDPMKWLCVSADDMAAAVSGDLVMFAMIDLNFENMDAVDLANTFVSLYGGSVVN